MKMAEGEGFEPPVAFRLRLISSQVPSTTQPPFHSIASQGVAASPAAFLRCMDPENPAFPASLRAEHPGLTAPRALRDAGGDRCRQHSTPYVARPTRAIMCAHAPRARSTGAAAWCRSGDVPGTASGRRGARRRSQAWTNARRSALIWSAFTVAMPCDRPG